MKMRRILAATALAFAASFAALPLAPAELTRTAAAQSPRYGALEYGYRTGYSDGYQAGWTDQLKRAQADARSKEDYRRADRAYISAYGSLEDYRDGYQQGYEVGYDAGYSRQGFDSNIPSGGVSRRGATSQDVSGGEGTERGGRPADDGEESVSQGRGTQSQGAGGGSVGTETLLLVELQNRLSSDVSQRGDRFEALVIEPQEYAGATVAGRLSDVQRAGKATGRALLQLNFDQIRMPGGGDWQDFSAQVVEVVPSSGETNVGEVDAEGGVRGKSTTKGDVAKVGAGAGIGAIIGGIAGGGKGAGIGAIIGGAAGTAGVMSQRGKEIQLERGQQLRIRTMTRLR